MAAIDKSLLEIIDIHKEKIRDHYSVESLSVFGSVSRGTAKSDSDIDILVKFRTSPGLFGFIDLKQYLEHLLGRPVDLVTEKALKPQLRENIIKDAVRVY